MPCLTLWRASLQQRANCIILKLADQKKASKRRRAERKKRKVIITLSSTHNLCITVTN